MFGFPIQTVHGTGYSSDSLMANFPIIRIAVNLSLIVALTIQPSLASISRSSCSTAASASDDCQGCQCCQGKAADTQRSCCEKASGQDARRHSHGCCAHSVQADATQWSSERDSGVRPLCLCMQKSAPANKPEQRTPSRELRDFSPCGQAALTTVTLDIRDPQVASFCELAFLSPPHFAQSV